MDSPRTDIIVTDVRSGLIQFRAYHVEVIEGPDAGASVRVERGSIVIGTSPNADLRLTDPSVSRAHIRVAPFPDGVDVTDLGSKNGTYSGGMRVLHARLAAGSELVLGRTHLRLTPEDWDAELEPSAATSFGGLIGESRAMRQLFAVLELVSPKDTPVLITGEPGVGKRRAAEAIHRQSGRAAGLLHVIDGASTSGEDLLAEVPTNVGSILVRDVDALPAATQRSFLRALEGCRYDARFLSTSRKDLDREVAAGRFERGLLLRLGVVRVRVPSLRERSGDIPLLIADLLVELGRSAFELGPSDLGRMQAYAWPDNVRELRTVIERAVSLESPEVSPAPAERGTGPDAVVGADLPYKQARSQMIEAFEREYVRGLLTRHEGNISKAARVAGIDRVYLHRLIKKYDL